MEQRWWKALQRLLDAAAFDNVGHMRDFEQLLERTAPPEKAAPAVAPPSGEAQAVTDTNAREGSRDG